MAPDSVVPAHWGQGIASQAVRLFIPALHEGLGIRRVVAKVFADNVASIRVLQKAGCSLEGTERAAVWGREGHWLDDSWRLQDHNGSVQLVDLADQPARAVRAYGSHGFVIQHLAVSARTSWATLSEGGTIGTHPAVEDQLLLLIEGSVTVAGENDRAANLEPGQGALWLSGETHTTTALTDSVVVIVEGSGLSEHLRQPH